MQAFVKILIFTVRFIVMFSALLLLQSLFYGASAPSNILSMLVGIISEEGSYITHAVNIKSYAVNFFNTALFEHLPFNIGNIFEFGWLWMLLLIPLFLLLKCIKNKKLFFAIAMNCLFLFTLHYFYGASELSLYAPIISATLLCLLVYTAKVLPKKIAVSIGIILLGTLIFVNSFGTYNVHRINRFVFGPLDIGDANEYKENIEAIKYIDSTYSGSKLFFYKALDERKYFNSIK
jgi:hypothetical protein